MPYEYYALVRFASMIIFGCMAFNFYKNGKMQFCVIAGSLVLLFQPFFKIVLGRTLWNVIDVVVAIVLMILWYKNKRQ